MQHETPTLHITNRLNHKIFKVLSLLTLCVTSVTLIALQQQTLGWTLFVAGVLFTMLCERTFMKHLLLVYISMFILGITPISTEVSLEHMLKMGFLLTLAVGIPYLISRYVYKEKVIKFTFHHGRRWYKREIAYIFITAIVTYFMFPYVLRETGSYLNWTVEPGAWNLFVLFLGTNALGIWDELFFVNTVLGVLRRHLSFPVANLIQSVLFTAFLYELGFQGWMFVIIFLFALLQGYIFKKTESLFYVITIHLVADLLLYLALIYLHHPEWLPIFIT